MKNGVHQALWSAFERWLALRGQTTKHDLKMRGLRERGDMFYFTRNLVFTGSTRLAYERDLKRFMEFCYQEQRSQEVLEIDKRDFRAYLDKLISEGHAVKYLNRVKSAIVKWGALHGKYESFHAMSRKLGERIRELHRSGALVGPQRETVSQEVAERVIARLSELNARSRTPRAYHLVAWLQRETGARAIEATERFTKECLLGGNQVQLFGKGGKVRIAEVSQTLHEKLSSHLGGLSGSLAPLRPYQAALRRAVRSVGGRVTGSHGLRRLWAKTNVSTEYWRHLDEGYPPQKAHQFAVEETVEKLGHSRTRIDQRRAYLGTG